MKAGVMLEENTVEAIRASIECVLHDQCYKIEAEKISESFKRSGGASVAADVIEQFIIHSKANR